MDDLKARLTRARHSVALSYAALQAPLTDDTCVTRTEVQNAVSDVLEAAAGELQILLLGPDVALTLSPPAGDEVEDTVPLHDERRPLHDERGADELRQALLARAARALRAVGSLDRRRVASEVGDERMLDDVKSRGVRR